MENDYQRAYTWRDSKSILDLDRIIATIGQENT